MKFDLAGKQIAYRALVPVSSFASTYTDLVIGGQGAVAATRIAIGEKGAFEPQETHLFDSSLNDVGSYDFVGNSTGGWVDGRWVALGWDSSRFGNPTAAGAPLRAALRRARRLPRLLALGVRPTAPVSRCLLSPVTSIFGSVMR